MINSLRGLLVLLCCLAGIAVAQEKNIVVTSGADRAIPIAVVPFGWQGGTVLPEDMAEIIGNDMRNTGIFQPIPRQNMISQPTQASMFDTILPSTRPTYQPSGQPVATHPIQ